MKIDRPGRAASIRGTTATGYTRRGEAVTAAPAIEPIAATASVLGIPEDEFTPRVRDAIMTLMGEVDSLRRELDKTRTRLDEVEEAADRDQLLPLLNRRAFVRELTRYIAFTERYGTPSSLIYFDLDGFKAVNDSNGHAAGDAVLNHFAKNLLNHVRESDVVGRLGGDEFGIILAHADQNLAHSKAASLAAALKTSPAKWNGQDIAVNFSYGAFELVPGQDADSAIARADEAMNAHKRTPRLT
jgi:diguanylate cyclase (GGDEF)-like protein